MTGVEDHLPQPPQPPQLQGVATPLVYVRESATWQYKRLLCDEEALPGEEQLNRLGAEGWELVTTCRQGGHIIFYFKRPS